MNNKIIASTGDIKNNYEVLGLVSTFFSTIIQKEPKTAVDIFSYLVEQLKAKASDMNGDGIIFIKVDKENFTSGYAIGSNYLAYGTVIKII